MLPDYVLPHHTPPPARPATLTVNSKGRVYPSKALLSKLGLRAGQPIDLLPPSADFPYWQLDLRPTASRRISWHDNTRPRIECVRLAAGLVSDGARLTLALAPAAGPAPGLYQLTASPAADQP